jgi:hypothetical protein
MAALFVFLGWYSSGACLVSGQLRRFSNLCGVSAIVQGGVFLRKTPLEFICFALHQLKKRFGAWARRD